MIGITITLVALVLHALTGWSGWDAAGSVVVGVLLVVVAVLLAGRSKALLLDESAPQDVLVAVRDPIRGEGWIGDVQDVQAVYLGPSQLLVNVWVTANAENGPPAGEFVRRLERLRAALLRSPATAQVTVTPCIAEGSAGQHGG